MKTLLHFSVWFFGAVLLTALFQTFKIARERDMHKPNETGVPGRPAVPAPKPKRSQFVAVGPKVLDGTKLIAGACSSSFARRIANALNVYTPDRRGQ